MRSCFYFQVETQRPLRSLAATSVSLYGIALFDMPSLEQHALVPPPSPPTVGNWALRSPECGRRVIPGTASHWPWMMCMIPAWYTCSSKPRPTTSTQANFARLHERRRALPPLRSVPDSFCRTWHDPARRCADPLAMRSICAGEMERPCFRERRSCVERLATSAACRQL